MSSEQRRDFFVSYTDANEAWARWICVALEQAGYTTVSQALDFRAGQDFVHEMHTAIRQADRTIAVLSPAYAASRYGEAEWRPALAADPSGEKGMLVPVRVQPCQPSGLLTSRIFVDLVDVDEQTARERLLTAIGPPRPRPTTAPFPANQAGQAAVTDHRSEAERFPGASPAVSNLPARNPVFAGRVDELEELHTRLQEAQMTAIVPVEAIHGLGGIGKTELVTEFAHRYRSDYDLIWWIPADQPSTILSTLAALASHLGIPTIADQSKTVQAVLDALRQRDRWLLVFDNVERPSDLDGLLPADGIGSVLITSRWPAWGQRAHRLRLGVLRRAESIQLLATRTQAADRSQFDSLAELLGDLPLALEESAAYLEQTGIGINAYLDLVRDRAPELFELAAGYESNTALLQSGHERRVATVWSVSIETINRTSTAAGDLLRLWAFLGPELPRALLQSHPDAVPLELSGDLARILRDPLAYNAALGLLGRFSLVDLQPEVVTMHRLVQAVTRAQLDHTSQKAWTLAALKLVAKEYPVQSWEAANWDKCTEILPSLLAVCDHVERTGTYTDETFILLRGASQYLRMRGQASRALPLAERAVKIAQITPETDDLELAYTVNELGRARSFVGDDAGALREFTEAVRIGESELVQDQSRAVMWRADLALALNAVNRSDEALIEIRRSLQDAIRHFGSSSRATATIHGYLGVVLEGALDFSGAQTEYSKAIEINLANDPEHRDVGSWHGRLGVALSKLGEVERAQGNLERAVAITEATIGPAHPEAANWRRYLAYVRHRLESTPPPDDANK